MTDDHPNIPPQSMAAWRAFLTSYRRVIDALADELAATKGLPLTWYDVLVQLGDSATGSLRMSELAGAVVLSKSGVTRLIDRMETVGLVARHSCPSDRRGSYAALTDKGRSVLADAAPLHLAGVERHFASHLSPEEAEVLTRALTRMTEDRDATVGVA